MKIKCNEELFHALTIFAQKGPTITQKYRTTKLQSYKILAKYEITKLAGSLRFCKSLRSFHWL